jgi:hypothetical protein
MATKKVAHAVIDCGGENALDAQGRRYPVHREPETFSDTAFSALRFSNPYAFGMPRWQ